jgi:hypothetical protein
MDANDTDEFNFGWWIRLYESCDTGLTEISEYSAGPAVGCTCKHGTVLNLSAHLTALSRCAYVYYGRGCTSKERQCSWHNLKRQSGSVAEGGGYHRGNQASKFESAG